MARARRAAPPRSTTRCGRTRPSAPSPRGRGGVPAPGVRARGASVTTVDRMAPFSFAAEGDRVAIGRPAESVARGLGDENAAGSRLAALRAAYFPDSETFACADLVALHAIADRAREPLTRRIA